MTIDRSRDRPFVFAAPKRVLKKAWVGVSTGDKGKLEPACSQHSTVSSRGSSSHVGKRDHMGISYKSRHRIREKNSWERGVFFFLVRREGVASKHGPPGSEKCGALNWEALKSTEEASEKILRAQRRA